MKNNDKKIPLYMYPWVIGCALFVKVMRRPIVWGLRKYYGG